MTHHWKTVGEKEDSLFEGELTITCPRCGTNLIIPQYKTVEAIDTNDPRRKEEQQLIDPKNGGNGEDQDEEDNDTDTDEEGDEE